LPAVVRWQRAPDRRPLAVPGSHPGARPLIGPPARQSAVAVPLITSTGSATARTRPTTFRPARWSVCGRSGSVWGSVWQTL